jgi:hypothetical protein
VLGAERPAETMCRVAMRYFPLRFVGPGRGSAGQREGHEAGGRRGAEGGGVAPVVEDDLVEPSSRPRSSPS